MADLFAPKLRGEPSYESPIQAPQEAPTYFEGIAKLGEFAFDAFTAYEKAEAKRQKATTSGIDPNLAVFAQDVQTIEKIRQEQGQQAANLFERQIAKKYAAAGIEFDTDYENVYEKTTGRSFDGYGRDMQAYMMEETFKTKEFQQNYRASFVDLPPDATEEQRTQYAIGTQAEIDSAALTVARFNAGEQKKWTLQGQAAYDSIIGGFLKQNLGMLRQMEKSGQPIGPQNIDNVQAQWAQAKLSLSQPPGVTDEQWKSTQEKIDNVDKMLATFEKATSNKAALEQLTFGLVSMIDQQGGGTDFSRAMAKAALYEDVTSLIDFNSSEITTIFATLGNADERLFNFTMPNLFGTIINQSEAGGSSANTIVQEYPEEITSKFSGLTQQELLDNLKAGETLASVVTPNSLNRPEARNQFKSATAAIGLLLSQGGSDDFLSSGFLEKLVGNRGLRENVNRFAELDPEGGVIIRSTLLTGLATESLRQSKNLASIERSIKGAKWDGSKYIVDLEGIEGVDGSIKQAFLDELDRRYDGSLEKAADDGFRRMRSVMAARSSFMRMGGEQDILYAGGFYDLDEAIDRRKAIRVLENASVGLQEAREGDEIGGLIQESFTEELPEQTSDTPVELDEPAIRGGLRGSDTTRSGEAGAAEVEQPSVGDVVLALGTNDFSNPEQAANNTRELIREVKARGGNPVIVPPNVNSEQFRAVADAIIAVANEEGATIEMAQYDPNDPLHLTMSEAERIGQKYSGAQVVGDSNAVRIMGMRETELTKTGAGTGALLEAFKGTSQQFEPTEPQRAGEQVSIGVKLPPNIEPEFVEKTVRISNNLGIPDPDDLFTVMSFETVGNMTSDIRNPRSGAVGLIQFTNIGIRDLGVTQDDLARMDRIEQLDYVERYFQPYKGKMKNLGDVYMAVFSPIGVGKPEDFPLYRAPSREYDQNREMDADNDGVITRGDALKKVMAYKRRIMK